MLGARPALGRLLTSDEDSPGRPAAAVLTDAFWSRRFGRDPRVLGASIIINGQSYEVVGILPQRFLCRTKFFRSSTAPSRQKFLCRSHSPPPLRKYAPTRITTSSQN